MFIYTLRLYIVLTILAIVPSVSGDSSGRVQNDLLAFYNFSMTDGVLIKDSSNNGAPLNLVIDNLQNVKRSSGKLEVTGNAIIRSIKPATKISNAIKRSGEVTIEAWIQPNKIEQNGPARIVTISSNGTNRNITLGQDSDKYDVRIRTSQTNKNGLPSLSSKDRGFSLKLTHIVFTRKENGNENIYINGNLNSSRSIESDTENWNSSYRLALANELTEGRPWQGSYRAVAIYGVALSIKDIKRNYNAGLNFVDDRIDISAKLKARKEKFFDEEIVPILSKHCLECHDTLNRNGKLDLSKKSYAYSLENGDEVIIPGKSSESLLWEVVESDDMPDERESLTNSEKDLLRKWIDDGAVWTTEDIDPLAHTFDRRGKENWVRRLTVSEYVASVKSATGVDIGKMAVEVLPEDIRADGFSNTAYNLKVDLKHIDSYSILASAVVQKMDLIAFYKGYNKSLNLTDNSMRKFISQISRDFLRGNISDSELAAFRGVTTTVASAGGTLEEAIGLVIEAMLQSPRFIYKIENQIGDGDLWSVSEYELASRMSYIIWGESPDKKLLDRAASGELFSPNIMDEEIERMLLDSKAITRSIEFVKEWLNLNRLKNLSPNSELFKNWSSELGVDMMEETLAFFEEVAWNQKRPLSDLMNANVTFASPLLAKHYGFNVVNEDLLAKYDLSSVPERGGLLTHGSVLTIGGDEASMVTRGLFVLHDLFRSGVKDPPPCVDTTPVSTKIGLTQRSIAEQRVANKSCGGCHSKFEPLAYGLEIYDGIGAFNLRDEHGNALRQDGEVLFPGEAKSIPYKTSKELMNLLSSSDRISQCLTWKIAQFALGRPLGQPDALALENIHNEAKKGGGTYSSVIKAIIKSDLVKKIKTEEANEE